MSPGHPELSLAPLSLHRPSNLDLVRSAGEAGYERVGLRLALAGQTAAPECTDPGSRQALKQALRESGVSVFEVSTLELLPDLDFDHLQRVVEAAADVGASYLQVTSWDPDRSRAAENLGALARMAASHDLAVGFEFMSYASAATLEDARWLLASAGPLRGGVVFDVLHFARSGGDPEQLPEGGDWLAFLQLCDAGDPPPDDQRRPEALNDRLPPGQGLLPLARILERVRPGPVVSVEAPCRSLEGRPLAEQAAVLRKATLEVLEAARPAV